MKIAAAAPTMSGSEAKRPLAFGVFDELQSWYGRCAWQFLKSPGMRLSAL
jgi:hypothetical protein